MIRPDAPMCSVHLDRIADGVPYRVEIEGAIRRVVCRGCDVPALPRRVEHIDFADGESPCGWCGRTPNGGAPWTTVHVGSTISRACVACEDDQRAWLRAVAPSGEGLRAA